MPGSEVWDAVAPLARVLAKEGTFLSLVPPNPALLVAGNLAAAVAVFIRYPGVPDARLLRLAAFFLVGSTIGYAFLGRSLRTAPGRLYGALLAPTAVTALVLPFLLPGAGFGWVLLKLGLAVVLLAVWAEAVLGLRGRLCLHALRRTLFPEAGGHQPLSDLARPGLAQVICATELQTGDQFYLAPTFVYGYLLGRGSPSGVDLAAAVQASAALPGAFPAQRRPTKPLGFRYPSATQPPVEERPEPFPSSLVLVDGGVYDNMGDEWGHGYQRRSEVWPGIGAVCERPERLVVVNASGAKTFRALRKPWLPAGGEIQVLNADKDVLYDQTTATRRRGLVARFEEAELKGQGLRGALVHITQNPYRVPTLYQDAEGPLAPRAPRAAAALASLDRLGLSRADWNRVARDNAAVPTTLAPLGDAVATRLIWHAYVLAAVNLHVILGFPLPPVLPTQADFQAVLGS